MQISRDVIVKVFFLPETLRSERGKLKIDGGAGMKRAGAAAVLRDGGATWKCHAWKGG